MMTRGPLTRTFSLKGGRLSNWTYRVIRFILAAIFLWSGVTKLVHPKSFAVIIEAYGLIPESWIMPVAIGLPLLEVIAAIGLLLDIRGSLSIITALLVLFMLTLGYGIRMGLDVDCGCFGPGDPESEAYHGLRQAFFRDMLMMAGVICLYVWRYIRSLEPIPLFDVLNHIFKGRDH